ncbi:ABC transporter ATP-binding protein [Streptococcus sp. X16XC17]|uniref:ABC transporter ATP-binding protein n=1 Tax=unclassified Streptococcus TaxID=2608887 RepID=UPI00066FDC24|nr:MULTISPECIES: ABC transporter ATP-binding protein [unclassified Streptococcus]TCD46755.1 ABC transporter ATP-binding protein [Streptococcus sp. X16XC17]
MFKLLKRMIAKELVMAVLSVVLVAFGVYLDLKTPEYMSEITVLLQTPGTTTKEMLDPGFKMIGLSLASFTMSVIVGLIASRLAASFITRLRSDIYDSVMAYSQAEIKKFSIPSLLMRTTNDLTQIQLIIVMGLQVVTKGPIMAIWAATKIAGKSGEWLFATLVAVAVMLILLTVLLTLAFPKQRIIQQMTDRLNSITRESLTGIRVVRAYNAEGYQDEKFNEVNTSLTNLNLFVSRLMVLMNPVMTVISGGLTLSIYWIGAHLINDVKLPRDMTLLPAAFQDRVTIFSNMVVFSSYAMQVVMGFMMMVAIFFVLPRSMVSAGRINEVLELGSTISNPKTVGQAHATRGQIEFKDVTFRYSEQSDAVIEHVSFNAQAGQTVAFIGSTGSGKSTLINLIPRLYDVSEGAILVDGQDVRHYELKELHKKVGYIPQKAVLFSGTIRSNMVMGESNETPLSDQDLWKALDLAQAREFVEATSQGLDEHVAQGGSNFSGGQKQRLAIARALARKPEILIFDDSFSALDYKTDKLLRKRLKEETADMTKLIVAQRISTIMDADQIVVLDDGVVVGQGTHKELLADNAVYQEIAYSQLSKEELGNGK